MKRDIKCPACSAELELEDSSMVLTGIKIPFKRLFMIWFTNGAAAVLTWTLILWGLVGLSAVGNHIGPIAFKVWQSLGYL